MRSMSEIGEMPLGQACRNNIAFAMSRGHPSAALLSTAAFANPLTGTKALLHITNRLRTNCHTLGPNLPTAVLHAWYGNDLARNNVRLSRSRSDT
jgi:hypothetical protein